MTQYTLNIALPATYTAEQFVVSEANALAHRMVVAQAASGGMLFLQGAEASGKTHLAHLWQQQTQAVFLKSDSETLSTQATIIENIETWTNETALFHLYNHSKLHSLPLLITSLQLPDALGFALPDLRSRLSALPLAVITPPDDTLIAALLAKQLADRQLKIAPDVMDYMLPRCPRSYTAIAELVARLDASSLETGRTLTIPYVKQELAWHSG